MALNLGNLVSDTLDKVKNSAISKAKDKLVSSITSKIDNPYKDIMETANQASGIVPDEGASEAVKRFDMWQMHTNRPKPSQQFYVLFQPRPQNELIYQNIIAGTPGTPSQMMQDLKSWGKRNLNAGKDWLSSKTKELGHWVGDQISGLATYIDVETTTWGVDHHGRMTESHLFGNDYVYVNGERRKVEYPPSWMSQVASSVVDFGKDVGSMINKGYTMAKSAVNDLSDFTKSATKYVFGTSGTPDQLVLYHPMEYKPISSGWLSSFANTLNERARVIEWGLFGKEDSYKDLVGLCDEISMHCVDTDRPSWEIPVTRYNQYNRDRLVYEKVKYNPITMTFYDTIDSALLKLLLFQLAFVNDSYIKTFGHFTEYTQLENFVNNPGNWGMNLFSNTGIFQAISIVEVWGDQCTVYNLMMPKITSVKLSKADATRSDVHKITITFEYEGMTNYNPTTLTKNDYDIMLAWAMSDSTKAAKIAEAVRMKYKSSLQSIASMGKDFFVADGNIYDKLTNFAQQAGFGSEIKLAKDIQEAVKGKKLGSLAKQLTNPSSITSKIGRLF